MSSRLYPYQDQTIEFAQRRHSSIIAHEPGLGKTACAILTAELPAIVVAPASVCLNWRREIEKWRPGAHDEFVIRSYADRSLPRFNSRTVNTVILDEVHYCKNPEAKRAKYALGHLAHVSRRGGKGIAISGTLVPNRPIELWPILYAMGITKMSYVDFAFQYAAAYEDQWHALNVRGHSNLRELRELLAPHAIRFTKQQVLPDLPSLTWTVLALDLPVPDQEKDFDLIDLERMSEPVAFEALSDVLKMHGQLKVPMAIQHVRDALEHEERVVVFAHHRDVVAGLMGGLKEFRPVSVMGGQTAKRKQVAQDQFCRGDASHRVLVGQLEACGVGVNLVEANHVIFAEGDWVMANMQQAADRCHRIGTKKNVTAEILTIHRSVDEHMLYRALQKQGVVEQILEPSAFTSDDERAMLLS